MEPSPSSGSEAPTSLLPIAQPAPAERSWLRSRRVQTFGLGALCGALGLSLVIVVTSIFAAAGSRSPAGPVDPAPASDVQPTPRATPTPAPTGEVADATTDASTPPADDTPPVADPAPEPEPAPAPTTAPPADETADGPGRSDTAPGHSKDPKKP